MQTQSKIYSFNIQCKVSLSISVVQDTAKQLNRCFFGFLINHKLSSYILSYSFLFLGSYIRLYSFSGSGSYIRLYSFSSLGSYIQSLLVLAPGLGHLPSNCLIHATSHPLIELSVPINSLHHNVVPVLSVDHEVIVDFPLESLAED